MSVQLIKSDLDKREYRTIKLENGLRAILVSDVDNLVSLNDNEVEESEMEEVEEESSDDEKEGTSDQEDDEENEPTGEKMAACALCINVGSFSDPVDIQGLAHFVEHMVFMGSAKFPKENAIDDFLKNRGGSNNAFTEMECTSFHIECREAHLAEGMDLFAQFFISPLMIKEAMTRERKAVDSEFEMAMPSDGTRHEQILASLAPKGHPARTFPWGNNVTLKELVDDDKLHRAVRDFWLRHYSADRMTVAVVARLPLDVLENYVRQYFSDVPNRHLPPSDFNSFRGMPWGSDINCLLWVKPIYDLCEVDLTWILPPYEKEYESRPLDYFTSLIDHGGEGSLQSFLKKKVLGLKVLSGNDSSGFLCNSLYSTISVTVELTKDGLDRIDEVCSAVFSYIAMLKENLPNKRYFDELRDIDDALFKYKYEEDAHQYAEQLAMNMHYCQPEHYIAGFQMLFKYNPELILSVLNYLTADNVNISIHCKDHPDSFYDKEEPWFKTKYRMESIPENWKKSWLTAKPLPEFFLPQVNQYVARRFSLLDYDESTVPAYPQKVLDTPLLELWYRQDIKFKRPYACFKLSLTSPCARKNPLNATLLRTLSQFVELKLVEKFFPALASGYKWSCNTGDYGLIFFFYGYDEKLPLLYEEVLTGFKSVIDTMLDESNESLFAAVKCDMSRSYYNGIIEASDLNNKLRLSLLLKEYNSDIDCLAEIKNITLEKLQKFSLEFLSSCRCFMLVQGNITQDSAIELAGKLPVLLNLSPYLEKPKTIIWNIWNGKEVFCRMPSLNPDDNNASITNYYQFGPVRSSIREICILDLIQMVINEPLFNSLRTQQQIGYDVSAQNRYTFGVLGFSITVEFQGNKFTANEVNDKIETFLQEFSEKLQTMTPQEFEEAKENLIVLKRIVDNNLLEEAERNFAEIASGEYMFDRLQREAEEIPKIALEEVNELFQDLIFHRKKKLGTQVVPGFPQLKENDKYVLKPICPDPSCYISDVTKFLENREFYPCLDC